MAVIFVYSARAYAMMEQFCIVGPWREFVRLVFRERFGLGGVAGGADIHGLALLHVSGLLFRNTVTPLMVTVVRYSAGAVTAVEQLRIAFPRGILVILRLWKSFGFGRSAGLAGILPGSFLQVGRLKSDLPLVPRVVAVFDLATGAFA